MQQLCGFQLGLAQPAGQNLLAFSFQAQFFVGGDIALLMTSLASGFIWTFDSVFLFERFDGYISDFMFPVCSAEADFLVLSIKLVSPPHTSLFWLFNDLSFRFRLYWLLPKMNRNSAK